MARSSSGGSKWRQWATRATMIGAVAMAFVTIQAQQDSTTFVNPHKKQLLRTDATTWANMPAVSPAARVRMEAAIVKARAAKLALSPAQAKISPVLRAFTDRARARAASRSVAPEPPAALALFGAKPDGTLRVSLQLTNASAQTIAALKAAGANVARVNVAAKRATATLSPESLAGVAAIAAVKKITPIVGGLVHAGSVVTEGDSALRANVARQLYGVAGRHIKVGVMSDGIESVDTPVATGNIPDDGTGHANVALCPFNDNSGDEGTAMLEIVHDLAPAARLAFCPGFGDNGQQGMADAITWLATQAFGTGVDVIVDDVGFLDEPYFQDGVVAQAVDAATAGGVTYVSAAGNSADNHYELPYRDISPGDDFFFPFDVHDFGLAAGGASDPFWDGLVAGAGNFFAAFLQWNDGFGRAANDYDLYIFDENGFVAGDPDGEFPIGAVGIDFQNGDDDPIEVAFIVNPDGAPPVGTVKPFLMLIDRFDGDPNKLLEMNFNGFFAVNPNRNVPDGSVWGHQAARTALAIAATGAVNNIDDTPNPGHDIIEEFSSRGPSRIFFDANSNPSPETRRKPNFTATDGVSVTGVNFVNPFFGTSAAAPHAAAIVALVKDVNVHLQPSEVEQILRQTALERGTPGFDTTWGYGYLDAPRATRRAGQVGNLPLFYMCTPGSRGTTIVTPEILIQLLRALGFSFGPCDPRTS